MPGAFRHQEFSEAPRGWHVRTVKRGSHEARIAFPPGARKKGSGRLLSILHPRSEHNPDNGCIAILEDAVREAGAPELGTPEEKALARGVEAILVRPIPLNGNPKSKTREALEKVKDKAVRFFRQVVGDDDRADDIEDMSIEEYADKKRIHLTNKKSQLSVSRPAGNPREKSKGHIGFTDQFEYFRGPTGDVFRALKTNYIDTDGYRAGARFESTKTAWDALGKKLISFNPAKSKGFRLYKVSTEHKPIDVWADSPEQALTYAKSYGYKKVSVLRSTKQKNLDEVAEAQEVFERFHDKRATGIIDIPEPDKERDDFALLGWLTRMVIQPLDPEILPLMGEEISEWRQEAGLEYLEESDWRALAEDFGVSLVPLDFTKDKVRLTSAASGNQLYLIGGAQDVTGLLPAFNTDTRKDLVALGYVLALTYLAAKEGKLGDGKPTYYEHVLAEEGGIQPIAYFHKLKKRIYLVGGDYQIGEWITN